MQGRGVGGRRGTQRARQVAERGGWDQQHLADRALGQTSHLFLVLESNATQVTLGSGRHGACVVREQERKEEEGEEEEERKSVNDMRALTGRRRSRTWRGGGLCVCW